MIRTLFKARDTKRGSVAKKSPVMRKLLSNPKIAKILNTKEEKREFYKKFKDSLGGRRVTTANMAGFLGKTLKDDKSDSISDKELGIISKEILGSGWRRYYTPRALPGKIAASSGGQNKETQAKESTGGDEKFSEAIKRIREREWKEKMDRLSGSESRFSEHSEERSVRPPSLHEQAIKKTQEDREKSFREKMDEIRKTRLAHLDPKNYKDNPIVHPLPNPNPYSSDNSEN